MSADAEETVGILGYGTATRGIGGRIKGTPEDFVVEEVASPPPKVTGGPYTVAVVRSRNWETNRLVREMSRRLAVSRSRIRFAGTKDKRAVTTQLFQFDLPEERVATLRLAGVDIVGTWATDRRLEIGDLVGNRFHIVVRELAVSTPEAEAILAATAAQLQVLGGFPNFFGLQRFGSVRPITHLVGRHIVRGEFRQAVDAYVANPIAGEDEETFDTRTRLAASGDYVAALKEYPDVMSFEKAILNYLVRRPGDYAGALQELPLNLQMMFVHGYQSYLFNRMLSERMRRGLPIHEPLEGDLVLPAAGGGLPDRRRPRLVERANLDKVRTQVRERKAFVSAALYGSEVPLAGGLMGEIESEVIAAEGLKATDFVIPLLPRLSSRGIRREIVSPVRDLKWTVEDGAARFDFELQKGAYATVLLREFMK